jgi:hypothetical protein
MSQNKSFLPEVFFVRYFVTMMAKVTNTENWYQRSGVIVTTEPDHVVLKSFELVCERNLEELGEG